MPLNLMERVIFLRATKLGQRLDDPALRIIAEVAEERPFATGTRLFTEGDIGTELFLLVAGEVEVYQRGHQPGPAAPPRESGNGDVPLGPRLATLKQGDILGELSVLDDQPRSASAVARTPVRVLSVQREDLRDAIALCPDLAFGLFRVLTARLRKTSRTLTITTGEHFVGRPG